MMIMTLMMTIFLMLMMILMMLMIMMMVMRLCVVRCEKVTEVLPKLEEVEECQEVPREVCQQVRTIQSLITFFLKYFFNFSTEIFLCGR